MSQGCLNLLAHLDPAYGGLSASLPPLCASTAAAGGFPSSIAAFCDRREEFEVADVRVSRLPSLLRRAVISQLARLIEASDIVHIHGLWQHPTLLGAWLSRRAGKPYVISAHGMLEPWALRRGRWKKAIYSAITERKKLARAACLLALTADEVENYRAFGLENPVAVVPNGVAIPEATRDLFLNSFPDLQGRRLVLYMGRIHHKKGPDVLVNAWASVARRFPETQLVVAGPDFQETEPRIKELAARQGIAERVSFPGLLRGDLKWSALAACTVFVLPSHSEGFSVAALEALASAKPVILSPHCHFPEVGKRRCGWIVAPQAEPVAQALTQALETPLGRLEEIGAAGQALVRERYSWDVVGRQMAEIYRWVLGGPKPSLTPILFQAC